jgi:hypothetical protein
MRVLGDEREQQQRAVGMLEKQQTLVPANKIDGPVLAQAKHFYCSAVASAKPNAFYRLA